MASGASTSTCDTGVVDASTQKRAVNLVGRQGLRHDRDTAAKANSTRGRHQRSSRADIAPLNGTRVAQDTRRSRVQVWHEVDEHEHEQGPEA